MKKAGFLFCLLAAAPVVLQAQQTQAGFNGFSFTSPLEVSYGTDRNFLIDRLTPEQKLFYLSFSPTFQSQTPLSQPLKYTDQVMLLTLPTTSIIADGRHRQFALSYQPEFEIFRQNSDQNSMNQYFDTAFTYYLGRRMTFGVRDVFRSSNDASRTLRNVFLLLPRSRYQENAFRGDFAFDVSSLTTVSAQFDNTRSTYGALDRFQVRVTDSVGNSGSVSISRMLSQMQRLRFTYSIFSVKPMNKTGIADEAVDTARIGLRNPEHFLNGDYRAALSSAAVVEVGAGLLHSESGNTYVMRAGGDRRVGQIWFGANYTRSVALVVGNTQVVANGLKANDVYDVFTLRAIGEPIRSRLAVDAAVVGSHAASGLVVDKSNALMARGRVDYRLSDRVSTFVLAESYFQNRNAFVNAPLDRTRFFLGLQYSFSSEEERRINRLNRDADYVSLTGRDPHRQGSFD